MAIFELSRDGVAKVSEVTFGEAGVRERADLQRVLRENVHIVSPDTLVIAEEFGDWEDSRRRVDLLGLDKSAKLVVIELKRTEDGGHMELQAIRYAAMVSTMTFEQVVHAHNQHLLSQGNTPDAAEAILRFLEWDAPDEDRFAQDVRIVLASAEFSKELTSSVMWLNGYDLDIRCVRLKPYRLQERILVDVQQIIPLPEAVDYQVQIREKNRKERIARTDGPDFTRYDVSMDGKTTLGMWKRKAIFFLCRELCRSGVDPEEINQLFEWRANRVWRGMNGTLNSPEYIAAATKEAEQRSTTFESRRWFCEDNELVQFKGKTYALSNQWGGPNWYKAMELLKSKYTAHKIEFTPTQAAEE
ncbi:MAG: hypothetical protein HS116_12260 [Planctomycetes bacterium]|nr:hypothetical protein [Planctomycetota bacterium]